MMRFVLFVFGLSVLFVALLTASAAAHQGPDPVAHWFFSKSTIEGDRVKPRLGPVMVIEGGPEYVADRFGGALAFDGADDRLVASGEGSDLSSRLPIEYLTVAATVTVDRPKAGVEVISLAQIHGEGQKGWFLGYNERAFCW